MAADMVDLMTETAHRKPCGCQGLVFDNKWGKARHTILCWHHSHGPGRFAKERTMSRHASAIETSAIIEDLKTIADEWADKEVLHIQDRVNRAVEDLVYAYDYMKELEESHD